MPCVNSPINIVTPSGSTATRELAAPMLTTQLRSRRT
jgi:hypothetical protein